MFRGLEKRNKIFCQVRRRKGSEWPHNGLQLDEVIERDFLECAKVGRICLLGASLHTSLPSEEAVIAESFCSLSRSGVCAVPNKDFCL